MDFTEFVLSHLPPAPARVLDVGCGDIGGVVPALAAAGYDAFGVDPRAPAGPRYSHGDYRDVTETYDAVVAGRILHHVHPLGDGLDKLAALAPLLIVDEFAGDLIDDAGQDWYENQYRMLVAAGSPPKAPASIDVWRAKHPDLHPHGVVLDGLRERYDERDDRMGAVLPPLAARAEQRGTRDVADRRRRVPRRSAGAGSESGRARRARR